VSPIVHIAANTFRETLRKRTFLNVLVFGAGMMLFGMIASSLSIGKPDSVVRSIGLSAVTVSVDLLALLMSVSLVYEEIQQRTLFVLLTRPVRRWQYVVGRFMGLMLTVAISLTAFGVVFFLILVSVRGHGRYQDIVALGAVVPEAALLAAFGVILSCFSTPTLSAGIGLAFWATCSTSDDLLRLTVKAEPSFRWIAKGIYYVLPSFARLNFREAAVYGVALNGTDVALSIAYATLYGTGLLLVAVTILNRREMI
jgi:ABC-type transport system involved in multi-copper enzyme maturation permease subunit